MKLTTRLVLQIVFATLGMIAISAFALQSLRETMIEERKTSIGMLVRMAAKQVEHYISLERSGRMSREEAQSAAKDALRNLRDEDNYIFVRGGNGLMTFLVHPDQRKEGKEIDGGKSPDGRTYVQVYLDALQHGDFAYIDVMSKRPRGEDMVKKINVVQRIPEWGWAISTGVFIDDVNQVFWRKTIQYAIVGGIVLLGVIGIAVSLGRGIYRNLGGEPSYAAQAVQIIASGDMCHELTCIAPPGSLLATMKEMQINLREMIFQIQTGANILGQASNVLAGQMNHIDSAAQITSDATQAMAASIEEMAVSISHISDNAKFTENHSRSSSELAAVGEGRVRQASLELKSVSFQVTDALVQIEGLASRSHEVGGIVDVISEIAAQTNLLALNAAIEAARAGEQGRGFAVVADEVRKLAVRSGNATDQIREMIEAIQTDISSVVKSMQTMAPQVGKGVEAAEEAAKNLREISRATNETLEYVRQVAHSTSEQSSASDNLAANVENISRMTDDMTASVSTANETVRELENMAFQLRQSVTKFRV